MIDRRRGRLGAMAATTALVLVGTVVALPASSPAAGPPTPAERSGATAAATTSTTTPSDPTPSDPTSSTTTTTTTAPTPSSSTTTPSSTTTSSSTSTSTTTTTVPHRRRRPPKKTRHRARGRTTGVPHVPTGGGSDKHLAKAPKGPSGPTGAAAVERDLGVLTARIGAVQRYGLFRRRLAGVRRDMAVDADAVIAAEVGVTTTARQAAVAAVVAGRARHELSELALAAYTGSTQAPAAVSGAAVAYRQSTQATDDADAMVSVLFGDAEDQLRASGRTVMLAGASRRAAADHLEAARATAGAAGRELGRTVASMRAAAAEARSTAPSARTAAAGPSILGRDIVTASQLAGWYASTGERPETTVDMRRLAGDYLTAGRESGVRADVAFAQSVVETGYFSFPSGGQLVGHDNNFAGIGACDSCAHGWSFGSAATGVATQLELLEVYAENHRVPTPLLRGTIGIGGCCRTWMALSGHWATNPSYGVEILSVYDRILRWVLPRRLAATGLR